MRKVYYITGITASGKTTAAKQLGEMLKLPRLNTDYVLDYMAAKTGYNHAPDFAMPDFQRKFKNIKSIKEEGYRAMLKDIGSGDFILEGFALSFYEDRDIIDAILGPHHKVFFYLHPDFKAWSKLAISKGYEPNRKTFDVWEKYMEKPFELFCKGFYEIKDNASLFIPYEKYQRGGLTDAKIKLLDLPDDFKFADVLDLGCNDGWVAEYCLKHGAGLILGIDQCWQNLENARAKGVLTGFENLNEDWTETLLKINLGFDYTLSLSMLHYIDNKEVFIKRCADVTRKEFILELPISRLKGLIWEKYNERYWIPSENMLVSILNKYFKKVVKGKQTPAPDGNSYRWVFKCYK